MIAELDSKPFTRTTYNRKIDYHQNKIDNQKAEILYTSTFAESLNDFRNDCFMIERLNSRVKLPFNEVSLNFPKGEKVSKDLQLKIACEYLEFLGYSNAAYAVIQHSDKEHDHLHILFTTIDKEGKHIKDSNLRRRSQTVSRHLEMEYNLQETKYNEFNGKSLSEMKAREYFFDNAFKKGMNDPKTREVLSPILATTIYADLDPNKKRTNTEYQMMFEQSVYDKIGNILKEHSHFKSLHKDELIDKLENAHSNATTIAEFKTNLEANGGYMRFVSNKGKSGYTYGLPDTSFYIKDTSLPEKFRYGKLNLKQSEELSVQEQKHIIYNQVFIALNESKNYEDFKLKTKDCNIRIIESANSRGIYGLSFALTINQGHAFKASDVSRKLSYTAIQNYFQTKNAIFPKRDELRELVNNRSIINEMKKNMQTNYTEALTTPLITDNDEDSLNPKKKKKNIYFGR